MAAQLLGLCTPQQRVAARDEAILADFTGGLDPSIDLKALATDQDDAGEVEAEADELDDATVAALPAPARAAKSMAPAWPSIDARPEDLVVIVGAGELGPYGSSRTRFEMEVDEKLSAAGVLELAWNTCLLYTSPSPRDVEESRMPSSA